MTNDIERHSPDEWRKTAAALMSESVAVGAGETTAKVNANGAPLLGDSRDLFRPKTSDIPAKPGVYKWRDGEGRVIYVGKAKNLRNRLTNYFQPLYLLHPRTQTMVLSVSRGQHGGANSARVGHAVAQTAGYPVFRPLCQSVGIAAQS